MDREVVGLLYYQGWTQAEVAELLQIDERTVRRKWVKACLTMVGFWLAPLHSVHTPCSDRLFRTGAPAPATWKPLPTWSWSWVAGFKARDASGSE